MKSKRHTCWMMAKNKIRKTDLWNTINKLIIYSKWCKDMHCLLYEPCKIVFIHQRECIPKKKRETTKNADLVGTLSSLFFYSSFYRFICLVKVFGNFALHAVGQLHVHARTYQRVHVRNSFIKRNIVKNTQREKLFCKIYIISGAADGNGALYTIVTNVLGTSEHIYIEKRREKKKYLYEQNGSK